MTESKKILLDRLKKFLDKELRQIYVSRKPLNIDRSACYTISKVATNILKGLNYQVQVRRVFVLAANEKGKEIYIKQSKSGNYDKDEVIREGGWIIGIGYPPDFHYVVVFPAEKEIMDLTYGQANRPQYGLIAEPYWSNEDNLPSSIVSIQFINEDIMIHNFNPIYDQPQYRRLLRHIINKGIKELNNK